MADAVEAGWQDVDQEAAHELGGGGCHDLLAVATVGAIVLPSEGDAGAAAGDQPAVGDGDTVSVAGQIGQYGQWPAFPAQGMTVILKSLSREIAQKSDVGRVLRPRYYVRPWRDGR